MKSVAVLLLLICAAPLAAAEPVRYEQDIHPLLAAHCVKCHGPDKQQAELRVDSVAGLTTGGNTGPAIIPGKSVESLLIEAVAGGDDASPMPPEGPRLKPTEIALLKQWIDQGAKGPTVEAPAAAKPVVSKHWAYQPIANPAPPTTKQATWARNPIDQFVLAKVEAAGLAPSPEADRSTLLRRLSLDLTGLPPTPEELDAFLSDTSAGAYEAAVERLLASPHYGEHWGRYWLDAARYADSNGYTIDSARTMWKYRDWVIDAINRDLPFDQFTVEQLAGDMLPDATIDQRVATGFHRNTLRNEEGGTDQEQFRVEAVVDRVSTTGSVFLGLTLGCARCHDHKYDAISQREFYQYFAIFNNADEPALPLPTNQQTKEEPAIAAEIAQTEKRLADVDQSGIGRQKDWEARLLAEVDLLAGDNKSPEVLAVLSPMMITLRVAPDKRSAAQVKLLRDEFQKHDSERIPVMQALNDLKERHKQLKAKVTTALVMRERAEPRVTHVHLRGDFLRPGAVVQPNVMAVLPRLEHEGKSASRLDFARWLIGKQNPLTARVTVNRVWQRYFGQGIVGTENDFGVQGDRPTHPELLDWLATRFMQQGWSMKQLHRLIVTSATYRQSSHARADIAQKDPYNKLLARQARLRLEAEMIRDAALVSSGLLSREVGGPGVYPPQPKAMFSFTQTAKYWAESKDEDRYRRAMYTFFWRSSPYPFLTVFDAPDANTTCTRRVRSNTPLQALTLANDPAFVEFAVALAARMLNTSAKDDIARVRAGARFTLSRDPTEAEEKTLVDYLKKQRQSFVAKPDAARQVAAGKALAGFEPVEAASWVGVGRVLLNLDEFVTRE
ncbi:MAG: PSD1 domain-containing protein [Planctomycetes bacterium]|nr:PSD1 domain-containing protein [Planctomycetota bacterium]